MLLRICKRPGPASVTNTELPKVTDNLRNVGHDKSPASYNHSAANQVAALVDKNAEGPITKQEA